MSKFKELAEEIGEIVTQKNAVYGNSFVTVAKAMELLYPNGIPVKSYQDVLLFARMWDKHSRIATDKDALDENPYRDLCGYALCGWSAGGAEKESK